MSATCPACGADGRDALALARLGAKHRRFARETNQMLTELAAELHALREAHSRCIPPLSKNEQGATS